MGTWEPENMFPAFYKLDLIKGWVSLGNMIVFSGLLFWVGAVSKVNLKLKREISFPILLRFWIENVNLIFPLLP